MIYHDHLTDLFNRRFYEEQLAKLDTKTNLPITLMMSDVNGLKLINDSFGHSMGDELLKKAAEIMKKGFRTEDIVARLGGDEFVIILPKTGADQAEKIIQSLKENASNEKVGAIKLSISFEHRTKNNEQENIQEIFKNAEDEMYRHKLYESASTRSKTIDLIMSTLYEKSHREMLHSKRVNEFSEMAKYVLEHQERWDGNGYPKGLKGEEISLQARIIAIADAYDAMTSD